jgi:hypothetical protein
LLLLVGVGCDGTRGDGVTLRLVAKFRPYSLVRL